MTHKGSSYWPGQANKPALLLMHFLGDSPEKVEPLAENLHAEGYPIFLLSYRSHQQGDLSAILTAPLSTYLEDARAAMKTLQAKGHQKIIVGGLSIGAFLALALACECDQVAAVISLSCPILTDLRQTKIPYFMRQSYYRSLDREPTASDRNQAEKLFAQFDEVLSGMNQWMEDNFEALAAIKQAVFIGHGQADEVVPVQLAERLSRLLAAEGNPHLHLYPQADHYLSGELVQERLSEDILAFLDAL
ncbi:alpha/beta fold hydrolase [Aerococcus sp. UMB8623]|uniref:alpha/beta hydrolase n=1 Tax=Aerococcus sp. UMB8623 TaxID=3046348 RepID=UPI00254E7971|nr:alpha/beta fold hydrolase [Aerococcus sp. UMB8623]MDK6687439.1 alpha/beta fold hydrolase [Aerococcus sp. UMB8623]